ncbi:MAG: flagellar hook capping FlgD N-terminal domain-containing protein [bacterium]|jgi:flagellar basal-body rod modification protein FlgD
MANVTNVQSGAGANGSYPNVAGSPGLGKNDFLQLLTTQMRYQDPLNPTNDREFIAQLAQFSSLEQSQNLNSSLQQMMAVGLLGKDITVEDKETGCAVSGVVEMVRLNQSIPSIYLGGHVLRLDAVGHIVLNGGSSDDG